MFDQRITNQQYKESFIKNSSSMLHDIYGSNDVIPYWVADSDFPLATPITKALQEVVDRGVYAYEFLHHDVYKAISKWNLERHKLKLNPDQFVQVNGVLTAIGLIIREYTQENDSILIQTPAYHQFEKLIKTSGRQLVTNPLTIAGDKYQLDIKNLEQKITKYDVKAIIFCNPHNPTGRVWSKAEIDSLVTIAEKHNVLIISDEIHSDIIFSEYQFTSLATYSYSNIFSLIGSPAKTFGMQNIANGYLYTNNPQLKSSISSLIDSLHLGGNNTFVEYATIAAFTEGHEWLDAFISYTQETVEWIASFIQREIPKLRMFKSEGTYQIWFDFSGIFNDPKEMITTVGKKAKMGLTPGQWFDKSHGLFMRMNIASDLKTIQESFYRLAKVLNG